MIVDIASIIFIFLGVLLLSVIPFAIYFSVKKLISLPLRAAIPLVVAFVLLSTVCMMEIHIGWLSFFTALFFLIGLVLLMCAIPVALYMMLKKIASLPLRLVVPLVLGALIMALTLGMENSGYRSILYAHVPMIYPMTVSELLELVVFGIGIGVAAPAFEPYWRQKSNGVVIACSVVAFSFYNLSTMGLYHGVTREGAYVLALPMGINLTWLHTSYMIGDFIFAMVLSIIIYLALSLMLGLPHIVGYLTKRSGQ